MQRFECPFCGLRDETEFRFVTEAGVERPEPAETVTAAGWSEYLHSRRSLKGEAGEIWLHLPCGEYFRMTRDTVTREVVGTEFLSGDSP